MADFGLSRIYSDPKQTATQGTITHMPPELVRKGVTHKSADVWAFGVLLWEMYSGQRAWAGMSYTQVMQAVGYEQRGPEWPDQAPTSLKVSHRHQMTAALLLMPLEVDILALIEVYKSLEMAWQLLALTFAIAVGPDAFDCVPHHNVILALGFRLSMANTKISC